jgi:REP element-mobilizing transposase RayT
VSDTSQSRRGVKHLVILLIILVMRELVRFVLPGVPERGGLLMGWPTRMYEPGWIYFATARCLRGRLLLRPSKRTNDVLGGVLSRAAKRHGVELFAFIFFSNHLHLLIRAPNGNLPAFMQYLLTNISKKVGALVDWKGPLWERRYSAEPVLDEEALLGRLRYILSHGVKEGFVRTCREWPGLNSLHELFGKKPRTFRWFDWSRRWLARSGRGVPGRFDERFAEEETLELTPLPLVRFARRSKWRRFLRRTLEAIRQQGRRAHPQVLGPAGVLAQDPHHRPERPKRSRRPWCHAVSAARRMEYIARYRAFRAAFSEASARWRAGDLSTVFPQYAFRPFLSPRVVASPSPA